MRRSRMVVMVEDKCVCVAAGVAKGCCPDSWFLKRPRCKKGKIKVVDGNASGHAGYAVYVMDCKACKGTGRCPKCEPRID